MNRLIFFIDARNLISGCDFYRQKNDTSFQFGYEELITYLSKDFSIIRGYYYDGAPHKAERTVNKENFFAFLRKIGITLRLKEIDFKKNPSQKGVDIFLATDMISLAYENAYDTAIILSGDGDYVSLIDHVKSKGKKVWIMSFRNSLSNHLKECADKIIVIDEIPEKFLKIRK